MRKLFKKTAELTRPKESPEDLLKKLLSANPSLNDCYQDLVSARSSADQAAKELAKYQDKIQKNPRLMAKVSSSPQELQFVSQLHTQSLQYNDRAEASNELAAQVFKSYLDLIDQRNKASDPRDIARYEIEAIGLISELMSETAAPLEAQPLADEVSAASAPSSSSSGPKKQPAPLGTGNRYAFHQPRKAKETFDQQREQVESRNHEL